MIIGYWKITFGVAGVRINALMAGTAWNLRKYMEKLKDKLLPFIFRLFFPIYFYRLYLSE
jgi:Kef-type K+ transport system membrane component KefB